MNTREKGGFTLIELMIVVAVTGILSAIAIPAYRDYVKRAQVTELLVKATEIQKNLAEYYYTNNHFPTVADYSIQVNNPSTHIRRVFLQLTNGASGVGAQGIFYIQASNQIGNLYLQFVGRATNNAILWDCTAIGTDIRLAPTECK